MAIPYAEKKSRTERSLGYLCVFEHESEAAFVLHQYAPSREALFEHLRGLMLRGTLLPTLAVPVIIGTEFRLVSVVVADFIAVPEDLSSFLDEDLSQFAAQGARDA